MPGMENLFMLECYITVAVTLLGHILETSTWWQLSSFYFSKLSISFTTRTNSELRTLITIRAYLSDTKHTWVQISCDLWCSFAPCGHNLRGRRDMRTIKLDTSWHIPMTLMSCVFKKIITWLARYGKFLNCLCFNFLYKYLSIELHVKLSNK